MDHFWPSFRAISFCEFRFTPVNLQFVSGPKHANKWTKFGEETWLCWRAPLRQYLGKENYIFSASCSLKNWSMNSSLHNSWLGVSSYSLTTGLLQSSLPTLGRPSWIPSWLQKCCSATLGNRNNIYVTTLEAFQVEKKFLTTWTMKSWSHEGRLLKTNLQRNQFRAVERNSFSMPCAPLLGKEKLSTNSASFH